MNKITGFFADDEYPKHDSIKPGPSDILTRITELGFISEKYESNGEGPGTISDPGNDPGGKSYGCWQLSINAGTLKRYLSVSELKANFLDIPIASQEFDKQWIMLADTMPDEFEDDQKEFIIKSHYNPAIRAAEGQGFSYQLRSIQEAIFSISVQHGGYLTILREARKLLIERSPEAQIHALYTARKGYVTGLSLPSEIKEAILKRYACEIDDVLEVCKTEDLRV